MTKCYEGCNCKKCMPDVSERILNILCELLNEADAVFEDIEAVNTNMISAKLYEYGGQSITIGIKIGE